MLLLADEARVKTQNNINYCATKEMLEIEEKINNAIANGYFYINWHDSLQPSTKLKLADLGYEIESGCQKNEIYFRISWS